MTRRFSILLVFSFFILLMFSSCDALEKIIPPNVLPVEDPDGVFLLLVEFFKNLLLNI